MKQRSTAPILFALLITQALAQALAHNHHQIYMIGISKDTIQELMDKNLRVIIDHVDEQMDDHFRLKGNRQQSELFFDQGEIVYEVEGLRFGSQQIEMETAGNVSVEAKVELAQIVVRLEQGMLQVSDVVLQVEAGSLVVDVGGATDAQLEVKEKCKEMLTEQIKKREQQLKLVLQKVEGDVLTTFSKKKLIGSAKLEQTMGLEGDRLVLSYSLETQKDGKGTSAQVQVLQFSPEPQHMRDIQHVIHESYVNQLLQTWVTERAAFSFTDFMFAILSETCGWVAIVALRSFMSTNVLQTIFPELVTQFGLNRKVDLSCGFNPPDHSLRALGTEAFFKDENILDFNLNFGCSLKVSESPENHSSSRDPESVIAFIDAMTLDPDSSSYPHVFRSFFFSLSTQTQFDFSEDVNKFAPFGLEDGINMNKEIAYIFGRIKTFDARFEQFHLYESEEDQSLKEYMNQKLTEIKQNMRNDDATTAWWKIINTSILNQAIPLVPFPEMADCIGLKPKDSSMEIVDGYAILAYDFDIKAAHKSCLIEIEERRLNEKERWARILQDGEDAGESRFEIYEKLRQKQSDHLLRLMPGMPSFSIPNAHDIIQIDSLLGGILASRAELLVQDMANQNFDKYKNLKLGDIEIPDVNWTMFWELIK